MRTRIWIIAAALAATAFAAGRLSSQEGQTPDPATMAKMMELGMPGEQHEMLASLVGEFDQTMKMWMMPGAPPMTLKAKLNNEMIMDGRFLRQWSTGKMGPQDVESLQIMGFDRRHGEFTSVGFDTMGTYFVTASGKQDETTGKIAMRGTDNDPMGVQDYTFELEIKSKDEYVFTVLFHKMGGRDFGEEGFKMVEVTSIRAK